MTVNGLLQVILYLGALFVLAKPLGKYMAKVYSDAESPCGRFLGLVERHAYRVMGVEARREMTWRQYAQAALAFSLVSFIALYCLQRLQAWLPLNPTSAPSISSDSAFNTSVSFVTNTNWQAYAGESTMSHLTQMLGLAVQNFASAAVGLSVLVALVRGFTRESTELIGNFWCDTVRGVLYLLLPLSLLLALFLVSQGVVQTFAGRMEVALVEPKTNERGEPVATQTLVLGPVASQIAIKQLGTNGGGFFNANAAHPFENPTPLASFVQSLAILLIPAASCFMLGELVSDRRQGFALLAAMTIVLVPLIIATIVVEQRGNPRFSDREVDRAASELQAGGNMEGKETRFGIAHSSLWAVVTTAASNGSVNSMHDSYSPLGGLIPMWLMQLGEVIFGGVGSGLYGMLVFAILAVFVAGLMVGRTPEYLGKKIGAVEMKMAAIAVLLPCAMVLVGTAIAVSSTAGRSALLNQGPHGFSEILYAFSSAANNNGSAFAGLSANSPFYNALLGGSMLIGRFAVMLPVLAIAGSLARKPRVPCECWYLADPYILVCRVADRRGRGSRSAELLAITCARPHCRAFLGVRHD
jgi:K+-transporting ATPase ATPase A chain